MLDQSRKENTKKKKVGENHIYKFLTVNQIFMLICTYIISDQLCGYKYTYIFMISKNHRIPQVGSNPEGSPSLTPGTTQVHLKIQTM